MNKRTWINLFLIQAVVIILVILVLTGDEETSKEAQKISDIAAGSINSIAVINDARENINFVKQQDTWRMTAPVTATANPDRINSMLSILESRSFTRLAVDKPGLERFGLADPAVTLKLDGHEFFFGGTNPLEHRRYLLFEDNVYLIKDGLYHQLLQPPDFFIKPGGN